MTDFSTTRIINEKRSVGWLGIVQDGGMTYQEWLIGMIASGPIASTSNLHDVQLNASHIISVADEIIKQLDDE